MMVCTFFLPFLFSSFSLYSDSGVDEWVAAGSTYTFVVCRSVFTLHLLPFNLYSWVGLVWFLSNEDNHTQY
ncbi:hypothetical protein EX30DRAFT_144279 [Ascodesmis nigricans]|uniref:Uncharacterized protein n=1 Tax=Ascodesmis nigricans TaxID=341454 RepID=A0A4S2N1C6_9PEZI|nr:hypothetical protein EX30DRAFT_144279 [Ascodesmis nigricans]